tara:strand:+ start:70 stop:336 length:267 start_codon:yes stop_codon:yes gene_type:complete
MSDNVISGPGWNGLPVKIEPNQVVIGFLEKLLQEARNGDIQGIGCVYVDKDWRAAYSVVGAVGGYSMQGGAQCVVAELIAINMRAAER